MVGIPLVIPGSRKGAVDRNVQGSPYPCLARWRPIGFPEQEIQCMPVSKAWRLGLEIPCQLAAGANCRHCRVLLFSPQYRQEVRLRVAAAANDLKRRVALDVHHGAERLRPVLEK